VLPAAGGGAAPPLPGPVLTGGRRIGRPIPPLLFGLPAGAADPRARGGLPLASRRPDPGRVWGGPARARRTAVDLPPEGRLRLTAKGTHGSSPSSSREVSTSRSVSVMFAHSSRTRIATSGSLVTMLSTPRFIWRVICGGPSKNPIV